MRESYVEGWGPLFYKSADKVDCLSDQQKQPSASTTPQTGGVGSDSEVWNQTQAVCMSNLLQSETINKQKCLQTSEGMTSTEKKRRKLIIYCSEGGHTVK